MLKKGSRVLHPYNRDLGPGEVVEIDPHRMTVRFPKSDAVLSFATENHPFVPLTPTPGGDPERWWEEYSDDLAERLLRREVDSLPAFQNRIEALELRELRESGGLGAYLGGRLRLFPHQLHVAESAFQSDPVRWLLADEVGLGKTIEACLILSRFLREGRAERVLIVTPETLSVQWLGELYRKFHQVFGLLDRARRGDVVRELGPDFNPFEAHGRAVVSLEDLVQDSAAARAAAASRPDLLVVDEAHRLERRPGHPGSPAYRAVQPIAAAAKHVLLLTATPLEADAHGFFRLLELLWPQQFSDWSAFERSLETETPIFPCTSSTRRSDIGGLPPRVPEPVDLPEWSEYEAAERAALQKPASQPVERRKREDAVFRAYAAPSGPEDPRLVWLLERAGGWRKRREKGLIFVQGRAALDFLKQELEFRSRERVAVFHEDLSPAQRDLEVAQFAQPDGPTLLISTECGGEGRNFEFCRRLILFDLPWDPALLEQRIGRLDRISRRTPVEIVYFRPARGIARRITELYERLGIFREALGGLERNLHHVEEAIRGSLVNAGEEHAQLDVEAVVEETNRVQARVAASVYAHLHQNRYRAELGPGLLARIPEGLEMLTERVVVEACRQYGFDVADRAEQGTWYFEFGELATVDALTGVPAGSRFLGTFDRETAVAREAIDFFAAGHPLVEGVLGELTQGHRGQGALLQVAGTKQRAQGLLVVAQEGTKPRWFALDASGRERTEWLPFLRGEVGRMQEIHPSDWIEPPGWPDLVRGVLAALRGRATPIAAAGFQLTP